MNRNLIKIFAGLIICFSLFHACKTSYRKVYGRNDFLANKQLLNELPKYEVRVKTPTNSYFFNKVDNDTALLYGYLADTTVFRVEDNTKNKFLQIFTKEVFPDSVIGFKKVQLNPGKIISAYESGKKTDAGSTLSFGLSVIGIIAITLVFFLVATSLVWYLFKSLLGCYIATLVYGDPFAPEVILLREYRDKVLKKYLAGRIFIVLYYSIAPHLIPVLKKLPFIQKIIRLILDSFIVVLRKRKIETGNL